MLTEEQAETIAEPDEYKLICALPGSGKTHTFISLVDKILDVNTDYRVLMVTFTNASAREMFERVKNRLGNSKAKRVKAATFASLMLGQFKVISKRRKPIIGPEQYSFVRRALNEAKVKYDDIDEWVSIVEDLGRSLDFVNDNTPSSRVFVSYTEILKRYQRFDLNMMARELIEGLNNGSITPYPHTHILVDEFQDTDNLQYAWVSAHGRKGSKIAVVGDDDQAIYSWRGSAGYTAFVDFQKDFDASGFLLSMCFRCKGNILHAAKHFIEHNTDRIPKDMKSIKEGEGLVKLITIPNGYVSEFSSNRLLKDQPEALVKAIEKNKRNNKKVKTEDDNERFRFVAESIQKSNKQGWAVLARTNKHLDSMEQAFSELGIDTVRMGGKSIFDNEHAVAIISLFSGVVNRWAHSELSTGLSWIGEQEDIIADIYVNAKLYGFSGYQEKGSKRLHKHTELFKELAQKASQLAHSDIEKFLEKFFTGVKSVIRQKNEPEKKLQLALSDIFLNITKGCEGSITQRARALVNRAQNNSSAKDIKNPSVVVLATMNGSKGLEWPRVWICEVEDKKVPMMKEESREAIEEERRLMYVAMTRAEEELYISYREEKESEFISEIQGQLS